MPLKSGKGTFGGNMSELTQGPQFQRTKKKFGKKKAMQQAEAIAAKQERSRARNSFDRE